jgi:O-antigen/teichoic acid export membrane protein
MIIIDYLFYYLTTHFTNYKEKLSWSTPLERTIYAVGIVTMFWMVSIWEMVELILTKTIPWNNLKPTHFAIIGAVLGFGIMQIYQYIYVKRRRFEKRVLPKFEQNNNEKKGIVLSILFGVFSFILPWSIFMIFTS